MALRCSIATLVGFASLALSTSLAPSPAGASTPAACSPSLPGAPGFAAGSVITSANPTYVATELNDIQAVGSRWIRVDVAWSDIQGNGPTSYDWSRTDPPIQGAAARGINVDGSLLYTPAWAAPAGAYDDHFPPTDPTLFAAFAATAVHRYAPMGVHTWEIWNEPNNPDFWRPSANVAQYATLLRDTYVAIKAADPTATVLTGGTSPESTTTTSLSPIDFLNGLYTNGAGGQFDAVAHHPYTFPVMPATGDAWSAWSQMNDTNPSLRSVMTDHGDGAKKIWATEYGAPTNEVTEAQQSAMIAAAYQDFASYSWAGPLFVYSYKDLGNDSSNRENWFGLMRYDGSYKPSWSAFQTAANTFNTGCAGSPPCTTYTSPTTSGHQVCGAIRNKYEALGGASGFLGYPTTDETVAPDNVGRFNHFANGGSIYWSPSTGAWSIHGSIRAKYLALRGPAGFLGYPTTDESRTSDGAGRFNHFNRAGSIFWTPSTGAWSIHGAIRAKWASMGWERSVLGYPATDETGASDGVGRFNHFTNSGSIFWTPGTGAWSIHGAIRAKWASMGWERSCLAYPVSDEFGIPGGRQSDLQRGLITFDFATGWASSSC